MNIKLKNFGHFKRFTMDLSGDKHFPNGFGKTTVINAYVWVLTGKTINGFVAKPIGGDSDVRIDVTLDGFCSMGEIRRVSNIRGGSDLFLSGCLITQASFESVLHAEGLSTEFIVACADVNVLTNPDLTSETLRKLLSVTDVISGDDIAMLRRELDVQRKKKREAEHYAFMNVTTPKRTVEGLNKLERDFIRKYYDACEDMNLEIKIVCDCCGASLDKAHIDRLVTKKSEGAKFYKDVNNIKLAEELEKRRAIYDSESYSIDIANLTIHRATKARHAVHEHEAKIAEIEERIRDVESKAIAANLPRGVELITSEISKTTNSTKSTCTLNFDGVPLKSINRSRRIAICIAILNDARERKGVHGVPIILDNAESTTYYHGDIKNIVRFYVM